MADKFKVIKCPQCGSVKNTKLRRDRYSCNNCGAHFILDSGDVNINHYHHNGDEHTTENTSQAASANTQKKWIYIGIIGSVIIGIFSSYITVLPTSDKSFSNKTAPSRTIDTEKEEIDTNVIKVFGFVNSDNRPFACVFGNKERKIKVSPYKESMESIISIYDVSNGKQVFSKPIEGINFSSASSNYIDIRQFENGDIYCIFNGNKLYKFNQQSYDISEVSPETYNHLPGMESGFIEIRFVPEYDGDGFYLLTETGKQPYYYPIIGKVYPGSTGNEKLPKAQKRTAYTFTGLVAPHAKERVFLIKYNQFQQVGYPTKKAIFTVRNESSDNPSFSDFFTSKNARLISYSNFTPGRFYFSPNLLAYNEKSVLISFKPTLSSESGYNLQLINAQNGEIKWTVPLEKGFSNASATIVEGGYLLTAQNGKVWLVNETDGQTINLMDTFHNPIYNLMYE